MPALLPPRWQAVATRLVRYLVRVVNGTDVKGWKQAAEHTGKSVASLRRLVAAGQLRAVKDDLGRHVFSVLELDRLRVAQPDPPGLEGATAVASRASHRVPDAPPARPLPSLDEVEHTVYRALADGATPAQIVLDLGLDPGWVRQLVAAWKGVQGIGPAPTKQQFDELHREVGECLAWLEQLQKRVEQLQGEQQIIMMLIKSTNSLVQAARR